MFRAAVRLGAMLSALMPCARVLAHGEAPVAFAVLSHDAEGARAVQLSHGVALRRGAQRFQFVCPSAWGDQVPASVAALVDGTIVVGATHGLMLLSEDGKVHAHPDVAAIGNSTELIRAAHGVFSLRNTPQGGSEVLAVDAQKVRVLWKDAKGFASLAALDDKLVTLREQNLTLEQVTIAAADGREHDRQLALLQSPVDYVFARAMAGSAYALVMFRSATVLGRLDMNLFTKVVQADLSIAGPLNVGESTLVALDGKLSQLVAGQAQPLAGDDNVLCLAHDDGLSYACNTDGITRVSGQVLGEPLFQFRWLVAPDLASLAAGAAQADCNAQWQDLRIDLLTAGTTLDQDATPDEDSGLADAAIAVPDADAPTIADAAIVENSGDAHESSDANVEPRADAAPRATQGASCATLPTRGHNFAVHLYLALAVVVGRRAIRRRPTRACARGGKFATDL